MTREIYMKPISVSIPDAVKLTGLGRSTIYEAMKSGQLPRRKLGSRSLILVSDLEAFVAALPVAAKDRA